MSSVNTGDGGEEDGLFTSFKHKDQKKMKFFMNN